MSARYVAPAVDLAHFTCPSCETLSQQDGLDLQVATAQGVQLAGGRRLQCRACQTFTWWVGSKLVDPAGVRSAPEAHESSPDDVRLIYDEARAVLGMSPRAAAALVRLALERLLRAHLGQDGSLDSMIGKLVSEGRLTRSLGRSMDALRLGGNAGAHDGGIRLDDSTEDAGRLFELINAVIGQTIGVDALTDRLIDAAPSGKRDRVEQRHGPPADR